MRCNAIKVSHRRKVGVVQADDPGDVAWRASGHMCAAEHPELKLRGVGIGDLLAML